MEPFLLFLCARMVSSTLYTFIFYFQCVFLCVPSQFAHFLSNTTLLQLFYLLNILRFYMKHIQQISININHISFSLCKNIRSISPPNSLSVLIIIFCWF